MSRILTETLELYRNAFRKTGQSLARGWMTMVAVVGFGFLLVLAAQIASPLGMAGGFLLGAANALLVGHPEPDRAIDYACKGTYLSRHC